MSAILRIIVSVLKLAINPLKSRKVRVAMSTFVAAYAAEYGLGVSDELVFTILGIGSAIILGIAHEDNGQKSAGNTTVTNVSRN
jgi:hypothetical protein